MLAASVIRSRKSLSRVLHARGYNTSEWDAPSGGTKACIRLDITLFWPGVFSDKGGVCFREIVDYQLELDVVHEGRW